MAAKKILPKLQNLTRMTAAEMLAIFVVLAGALLGTFLQAFAPNEKPQSAGGKFTASVFDAMDSLAAVQKTTYIGTDMRNNPEEDLAAADTVVERDSYFPKPAKSNKITSGKININTASKNELMRLPWVGEKTAEKIIEYRENNPFENPADIKNIKGIGDKKFEKMEEFIEISK